VKTSELLAILKSYHERSNRDDCRVSVKTASPSIGPMSSSPVKGAGFGFDWDNGNFIIYPEKTLVEKPESMAIYHAASELIFAMAKQAYNVKKPSWAFREALDIFNKKHPNWQEKYPTLLKM
jgi:hypothetical protein